MNTGIKNVIFDLGGVIINLSVERTFEAFAQLSGLPVEKIRQEARQPFFFDYEKGLISDADFRHHLRKSLQTDASDEQLDNAWNAMLLDIPVNRLALLERLKQTHRIFLLSNTNHIHLRCFTEIVKQTSGSSSIQHYFHEAYFSHVLNMRKPDMEIYEHVLKHQNILAAETVFLDDSAENIAGAARTGLHTFHVQHPDQIFDYFA